MEAEVMRFAYADPPYEGRAYMYRNHVDYKGELDHEQLVRDLVGGYPDGWALSISSPMLRRLLPCCPEDVRVMAWVKPFCSFKRGVNPGYCWEPVLVRGGRKKSLHASTVRDYVSANATIGRGLAGAKPVEFCEWIFEILGAVPGDDLVDMFPGSGAVTTAWESWRSRRSRRIVIVGQAPGKRNGHDVALSGPCGRKLALAAGLSCFEELRQRATLTNLSTRFPGRSAFGKGDEFPAEFAQDGSMTDDVLALIRDHDLALLLGRKTATTISRAASTKPPDEYLKAFELLGVEAAVFPHPSGISRWWNRPGNRKQAEIFLRRIFR